MHDEKPPDLDNEAGQTRVHTPSIFTSETIHSRHSGARVEHVAAMSPQKRNDHDFVDRSSDWTRLRRTRPRPRPATTPVGDQKCPKRLARDRTSPLRPLGDCAW